MEQITLHREDFVNPSIFEYILDNLYGLSEGEIKEIDEIELTIDNWEVSRSIN